MIDDQKTPPPRLVSAADTQAGYLYHKAKPSPRRRYTPSGPARSSSAKNPERRGPGQSQFRTHLILLAVVLGLMGGLLYMALHINRRGWEKKQVLARRSVATASDARPLSSPRSTSPGLMQPTGTRPTLGPSRELDKDSIHKAMTLYEDGKRFEGQRLFDQAIRRYREAAEVWPYLEGIWTQLGRAYMQVNDFRRAQSALEKSIEYSPPDAPLLNDLGVTLLHQKRLDKALDYFNSALEVAPDFEVTYFNLGLCHLSANNMDEARQAFTHYLQLKPDDARAHKEVAYTHAAQGHYAEAMASLEQAMKIDPAWFNLYLDAAAAAALMNESEKSLAYLQQAEQLAPPATIYRMFQEPAFKTIRQSPAGQLFEKELLELMERGRPAKAPAAS
jgi:tetratricopeptide (TPR) repeat protein